MKKRYSIEDVKITYPLVIACTAFWSGLKLDGYIGLPWSMVFSPIWFPVAACVLFTILWCVLVTVINATHSIARKLRGGL